MNYFTTFKKIIQAALRWHSEVIEIHTVDIFTNKRTLFQKFYQKSIIEYSYFSSEKEILKDFSINSLQRRYEVIRAICSQGRIIIILIFLWEVSILTLFLSEPIVEREDNIHCFNCTQICLCTCIVVMNCLLQCCGHQLLSFYFSLSFLLHSPPLFSRMGDSQTFFSS